MAKSNCSVDHCSRDSKPDNKYGFCFYHENFLNDLLWMLPKISMQRTEPQAPPEPKINPLWTPGSGVPSGIIERHDG